ncbi:MAG UNVERIFIED_CONTAM: hypothetical protein LVR18_51800 [Planctomycetaceae bacterium]
MTPLLQTLFAQPDLLRLCDSVGTEIQWSHAQTAGELLDLPVDRKPDTLFLDVREITADSLERDLSAIGAPTSWMSSDCRHKWWISA